MNCGACSEDFIRMKDLVRHVSSPKHQSRYSIFTCTPCSLSLYSLSKVIEHVESEEHSIFALATGIQFDVRDSDNQAPFPPLDFCIICSSRTGNPYHQHMKSFTHRSTASALRDIYRKKTIDDKFGTKAECLVNKLINVRNKKRSGGACRSFHCASQFVCELCNIYFYESENLKRHLKNRSHVRMEKFMLKISGVVKGIDILPECTDAKIKETFSNSLSPLYYCDPCCIWIETTINFLNHTNGNSHTKNLTHNLSKKRKMEAIILRSDSNARVNSYSEHYKFHPFYDKYKQFEIEQQLCKKCKLDKKEATRERCRKISHRHSSKSSSSSVSFSVYEKHGENKRISPGLIKKKKATAKKASESFSQQTSSKTGECNSSQLKAGRKSRATDCIPRKISCKASGTNNISPQLGYKATVPSEMVYKACETKSISPKSIPKDCLTKSNVPATPALSNSETNINFPPQFSQTHAYLPYQATCLPSFPPPFEFSPNDYIWSFQPPMGLSAEGGICNFPSQLEPASSYGMWNFPPHFEPAGDGSLCNFPPQVGLPIRGNIGNFSPQLQSEVGSICNFLPHPGGNIMNFAAHQSGFSDREKIFGFPPQFPVVGGSTCNFPPQLRVAGDGSIFNFPPQFVETFQPPIPGLEDSKTTINPFPELCFSASELNTETTSQSNNKDSTSHLLSQSSVEKTQNNNNFSLMPQLVLKETETRFLKTKLVADKKADSFTPSQLTVEKNKTDVDLPESQCTVEEIKTRNYLPLLEFTVEKNKSDSQVFPPLPPIELNLPSNGKPPSPPPIDFETDEKDINTSSHQSGRETDKHDINTSLHQSSLETDKNDINTSSHLSSLETDKNDINTSSHQSSLKTDKNDKHSSLSKYEEGEIISTTPPPNVEDNNSDYQEYYCELCEFLSHNAMHYDKHLKSAQHMKMRKLINKKEKKRDLGMEWSPNSTGPHPLQYNCELCDVFNSGYDEYTYHLDSPKHKRNQWLLYVLIQRQ